MLATRRIVALLDPGPVIDRWVRYYVHSLPSAN
jgi:hypothetical protein